MLFSSYLFFFLESSIEITLILCPKKWKLGKRVFPGMHCVLGNRSECLSTFIVGEGHYNSSSPVVVCPVYFNTVTALPQLLPCQGVFKCPVLLASTLMRHHPVQVAG